MLLDGSISSRGHSPSTDRSTRTSGTRGTVGVMQCWGDELWFCGDELDRIHFLLDLLQLWVLCEHGANGTGRSERSAIRISCAAGDAPHSLSGDLLPQEEEQSACDHHLLSSAALDIRHRLLSTNPSTSFFTQGTKTITVDPDAGVVSLMGYFKLSISFLKYLPQLYWNYQRKSTKGWSIANIILDLTGGLLSFGQMAL